MTIEERLCFIRAGYSAQDIAAFEAAEEKPAADPAPANEPTADPAPANEPAADPAPEPGAMPAWAKALQASLDEVKRTMQANNRLFDDMGDDLSVEDAADSALAKYLTGKAPAKSNKTGGTRK